MLAAAVVLSLWRLAGWSGLIYPFGLALLCLPGVPLGRALFGRHPVSWLTGVLLGYAIATLAVWSVVAFWQPSLVTFTIAWVGAGAASWAFARRVHQPLVVLPPWSRRTTGAFLAVLLLVPILVERPLERIGALDADGNRQYRAYFIADFVWHTALTAELAKQAPQPRNPFLASEPVHYYWTYFRIPGSVAGETGWPVERILKLNAFITALLLLSAIYVAAWAALPAWPAAVAAAVALTALGASVEGWAGIADIVRRGLPLSELRDLNIDALAAWAFKGLRIDNLPRTMWYTPQHGFSCALGLLAVPIALTAGAAASSTAIFMAGCALGASVAFNPLLGGVFCAVYGLTVLADAIARRLPVTVLLRHTVAVVPVLVALGWCSFNQVGEGAGGVLHIGFWGLARNATAVTFLLQFGPLLLPIAYGLLATGPGTLRNMAASCAGIVLAVLVMHFVALTVDLAWVGFRGGNIFFVLAPALIARGLAASSVRFSPRLTAAGVGILLAAGLPTTAIDAFNAQDVENRHLSRDAERVRGTAVTFDPDLEFHWTVLISPAQAEALDWIRTHTPTDAVVQAEPLVRGREVWSLIPSIAERRMATGVAIPLLARPIYDELNHRVERIYASDDAHGAWSEARALGIGYLYVDQRDRQAHAEVSKFDAAPEFFVPVFRNTEAGVYQVVSP